MQFYRCKCGGSTSHTSMGVSRCTRCPKCKSDLAQGPSEHREPPPHEMVRQKVDADEGEAFNLFCWVCLKSKAKIEERGDPWVWKDPAP